MEAPPAHFDAVALVSTVILVLFFLNVVRSSTCPSCSAHAQAQLPGAIGSQTAADLRAKFQRTAQTANPPQALGDSLQLRRKSARCLLCGR